MTQMQTATIIGGGIGGLATARALIQHGWRVRVLERARSLPATGTMLGMWPQAMAALDAIGVGDEIRRVGSRIDGTLATDPGLRTPSGRMLASVPSAADVTLVARPALLAALAAGLDIEFGTPVDDPGRVDDGDLLVGADGTFSLTRADRFGERWRARPMGAVAWRGTIDGAVNEHGETWAPGALFGITPGGVDRTNWYACIRADSTFPEPHLPQLLEHFGSWHDGVREVLARIEEDGILHHRLFESARLPSYVSGRTVLVGDAAHSMGPFLGRGACEALVDGATLGGRLAGAVTVEEGLAAYDRTRRRRTQRLVRLSRLTGRLAMMKTGSSTRNALLAGFGRVLRPRPHAVKATDEL